MRQLAPHQRVERTSQSVDEAELITWHFLELMVVIAGGATAALGLAVMAGWHMHNVTLVQVDATLVPMHYNAALGFVQG